MDREAGNENLRYVADPGEAAEWLGSHLEPGDAVLIKGSRSVGMETIAEALAAEREGEVA